MSERPSIFRHLLTACLILAACVMLGGCSIIPSGKTWWNPTTWFSGRALTTQQAAQKKEDQATLHVETAKAGAVHAAHIEIVKAGLTLTSAASTPDTALAHRFIRGGLGLLDQIDPLSAVETAPLFALVEDLRSGDAKRVAAAEALQSATESKNILLSEQLRVLEQKLATAQLATRKKDQDLAAAFIRENELADTLRNQRFIMWAAIGGVIFFCALSLYLRIGLGSVGKGLSFLQPMLGPEKFGTFIDKMDAGTDWFHQILIGSGRSAADAARAKALADAEAKRAHEQALARHSPYTP